MLIIFVLNQGVSFSFSLPVEYGSLVSLPPKTILFPSIIIYDKCSKLTTDSKYVSDGITLGWAKSWKAKGWRKADGKPALNPELWEALLELLEKHEVEFVWVKGHAGHPENERCDRLAVQFYTKLKG